MIKATDGKLTRLLVDDEAFDVLYGPIGRPSADPNGTKAVTVQLGLPPDKRIASIDSGEPSIPTTIRPTE